MQWSRYLLNAKRFCTDRQHACRYEHNFESILIMVVVGMPPTPQQDQHTLLDAGVHM